VRSLAALKSGGLDWGLEMWGSSNVIAEERCPIGEELLAIMYRAKSAEIRGLLATIVPSKKAPLALFCYRRSHLHDLALAIAATCERSELAHTGGNAGEAIFIRSRATPAIAICQGAGNKITLATGKLRTFAFDEDLEDEAQPVGEPLILCVD
jgi:hypothetical protein